MKPLKFLLNHKVGTILTKFLINHLCGESRCPNLKFDSNCQIFAWIFKLLTNTLHLGICSASSHLYCKCVVRAHGTVIV